MKSLEVPRTAPVLKNRGLGGLWVCMVGLGVWSLAGALQPSPRCVPYLALRTHAVRNAWLPLRCPNPCGCAGIVAPFYSFLEGLNFVKATLGLIAPHRKLAFIGTAAQLQFVPPEHCTSEP